MGKRTKRSVDSSRMGSSFSSQKMSPTKRLRSSASVGFSSLASFSSTTSLTPASAAAAALSLAMTSVLTGVLRLMFSRADAATLDGVTVDIVGVCLGRVWGGQ
jgi:hypothetical protein